MNKNHKERYKRIRLEAISFLGGKCVKCGSANNLEFDHINPTEKALKLVDY